MKNLKVLFTVLCVACACLNTTDILAAISGTWTETAFSDIPNGATIIIASNTDKALPSDATTASPTQVAITITGTAGNLTIVPTDKTLDDLVWTIDNSTSSAVKFITYGTTNCYLRLSSTSSNTALRVATTNSNNTFTMGSNGKLLKLSTANRYVGIYSSGSDWRTYNSESATNYGSTSLKFYVLNSGSSGSTETTYSVTFNTGTNGTCSTKSLTEASTGSGVTLPNCTLNTGYTFVGWATTSSATKADAGAAGVNYKPNSNCTLYAVYSANQITWTITFTDKMHSTTIPSQTVSDGGTFTFPSVEDKTKEAGTCAGEHYHFVGWLPSTHTATSITDKDLYTAGTTSPAITADATYYAVWAKETEQ